MSFFFSTNLTLIFLLLFLFFFQLFYFSSSLSFSQRFEHYFLSGIQSTYHCLTFSLLLINIRNIGSEIPMIDTEQEDSLSVLLRKNKTSGTRAAVRRTFISRFFGESNRFFLEDYLILFQNF